MDMKQTNSHQAADTQRAQSPEDTTVDEAGIAFGENDSDTAANVSADTTGNSGNPGNDSMEEQLERLAALNLSSAYATQSRFSPTIIRLISAAAGVAALLLIYFCFKLFI